jgi:hypothetical protein
MASVDGDMAGDDRDDFGIGALGSHKNRVHGDRSRATRLQIDEPAVVRQPPISEKPRTLDVYTQAVTPAKHAAQAAVMSLVFSSDKSGGALVAG